MDYRFACCTDRGTGRKHNQDALLLKQASCREGQILLAMVCDGMGGLMRGEVASAALIRSFSDWFEKELPELLTHAFCEQELYQSWDLALQDMNRKIEAYGKRYRFQLGTTVTAMLFVEKAYYIMHVGDSRAYEIRGRIRQLTRDQTLVQREVERGLLTRAEAVRDSRRNVLLQCVGASGNVRPAYQKGILRSGTVYVLCCDGFRHAVSAKELQRELRPSVMKEESRMKIQLEKLVRLNRLRGEQDDISAIAVRVRRRKT